MSELYDRPADMAIRRAGHHAFQPGTGPGGFLDLRAIEHGGLADQELVRAQHVRGATASGSMPVTILHGIKLTKKNIANAW